MDFPTRDFNNHSPEILQALKREKVKKRLMQELKEIKNESGQDFQN